MLLKLLTTSAFLFTALIAAFGLAAGAVACYHWGRR